MIGRCGYCRWWKQVERAYLDCDTSDVSHECAMLTEWHSEERVLAEAYNPSEEMGAAIYTHADFGCILWEQRDER